MIEVYRHEYKYRISNFAVDILKNRLSTILRPDKNAGPSGSYLIRSLYFDDIEHTAFHEKLSGISERAKYRLRFYNYNTDYIVFEKKEKHGLYSRKQTATVSQETAYDIIDGVRVPLHLSGQPLLEEYAAISSFRGFKPHVLVDYDRVAFTYPVSNVRITLDLNIRTTPFKSDFFNSKMPTIPVFPDGEQLLEIKFNEFLPEFINDLFLDIPKTMIANSKYTLCLSTILE